MPSRVTMAVALLVTLSACGGGGGNAPNTVTTDAPMLYLRLNDPGCLIAADSSGNAHDGTYTSSGTVSCQVSGLLPADPDRAIAASGWLADDDDNGIVRVPAHSDFDASTAVSLEAWIQQGGGDAELIRRGNQYILQTSSGIPTFGLTFGSNEVHCGSADLCGGEECGIGPSLPGVTDGGIHHVVATYDSTAMKVYVDGILYKTCDQSGSINSSAGFTVKVGGGPDTVLRGTLDEVALYRTALSATRIAAHYNLGTGAAAASDAEDDGIEARN